MLLDEAQPGGADDGVAVLGGEIWGHAGSRCGCPPAGGTASLRSASMRTPARCRVEPALVQGSPPPGNRCRWPASRAGGRRGRRLRVTSAIGRRTDFHGEVTAAARIRVGLGKVASTCIDGSFPGQTGRNRDNRCGGVDSTFPSHLSKVARCRVYGDVRGASRRGRTIGPDGDPDGSRVARRLTVGRAGIPRSRREEEGAFVRTWPPVAVRSRETDGPLVCPSST